MQYFYHKQLLPPVSLDSSRTLLFKASTFIFSPSRNSAREHDGFYIGSLIMFE